LIKTEPKMITPSHTWWMTPKMILVKKKKLF
jgi:hypothetical protein